MRHVSALEKQQKEAHGGDPDRAWHVHVEGALGEMVVAKHLGEYYPCTVDTYKDGADVGSRLQVRTRGVDTYDLLVRRNDRVSDYFVLVTGRPPIYTIRGWLLGADAKRKEWLASYGNREPAYFVPQSELRDVADLPYDATIREGGNYQLKGEKQCQEQIARRFSRAPRPAP